MVMKPDVDSGVRVLFEVEYLANSKFIFPGLNGLAPETHPTGIHVGDFANSVATFIAANAGMFNAGWLIHNVIARSLINGGPEVVVPVNLQGTRTTINGQNGPEIRKIGVWSDGTQGRRHHNQMYWFGSVDEDIDLINRGRFSTIYTAALDAFFDGLTGAMVIGGGLSLGVASYADGVCRGAINSIHTVNQRVNIQKRILNVD